MSTTNMTGVALNARLNELEQQRNTISSQISSKEQELMRLERIEQQLLSPETRQATTALLKELIGPFNEHVLALMRKQIRSQRAHQPNPSAGPQPLTDVTSSLAGTASLRAMRAEEPYELNLLVVGPSGIGKRSLIASLVAQYTQNIGAILGKTNGKYTVADIQIDQFVLRLRTCVIKIDDEAQGASAVAFVKQQHQSKFEGDLSAVLDITVPKAVDNRVHACIYVLPASARDNVAHHIQTMAQLHPFVNIIPVIGRCDAFPPDEIETRRHSLRALFEENNICVYNNAIDQKRIPFAVAAGQNGTVVRGAFNADTSSDLPMLRAVLLDTHTANLKSLTHTSAYARYRQAKRERLQELERKPYL